MTAYKLIKEHKNLENVIEHLKREKKDKFKLPGEYVYEEIREIFKQPEVIKGEDVEVYTAPYIL